MFDLTSTLNCGFFLFIIPAPIDPSLYYPNGHLQFDIQLVQPASNFSSMFVEYENSSNGNDAQYIFPASFINSLSTSSFKHVSLPFSSFTTSGAQNQVDTPFVLHWGATVTGTAVILDNIEWTGY